MLDPITCCLREGVRVFPVKFYTYLFCSLEAHIFGVYYEAVVLFILCCNILHSLHSRLTFLLFTKFRNIFSPNTTFAVLLALDIV